jgi:alkane 1-monooxygenase
VEESFYQFWPRTVLGSLRSAWNLEKRRIARRRQHPFRLSNDVLNAWLMSAVLWGAMVAVLGVGIAPYLVIQAVVGFSLLEVVNYMEHYGMLRQKIGVGERQRYERVDPSHSWNSNNIATNVLLYHLQRHSDHHANPTRRYQALRHVDEAPQLPTGYAGMIVLAWIPPVWRRVMDHRLLEHYDGDVSRANIEPRKLGRVLSRYGAGRGAVA